MKMNLITYKNQKIHYFFLLFTLDQKYTVYKKSVGSALKVHSF